MVSKTLRQACKLMAVLWCCTATTRKKPGIIILGILLHLHSIDGCNDVAHVSAQENACFEESNRTTCQVNSVSLVSIRAQGSTSCLRFQHDGETLKTLKIKAESLNSYCQKRLMFHSRDFTITHEFTKRCDSAGSCSIAKCANIKPNEDIPEISKDAKEKPGYTQCASGCGGWHCSCFYYDPSCLFFRFFARPTSNEIYQIYACPTWIPKLRVSIEFGNERTIAELSPGEKFKLPKSNVYITAVGLTSPPLQVHTATFIASYGVGSKESKWTSFTMTPPSAAGSPAKGFPGELQCPTRADAESFNCVFDPDLCKCIGHGTQVNCQCANELMSDYGKGNKL